MAIFNRYVKLPEGIVGISLITLGFIKFAMENPHFSGGSRSGNLSNA